MRIIPDRTMQGNQLRNVTLKLEEATTGDLNLDITFLKGISTISKSRRMSSVNLTQAVTAIIFMKPNYLIKYFVSYCFDKLF